MALVEPVLGRATGMSVIRLRYLDWLGDGARSEWEKLVTSLVKVDHPDARNPTANAGDQGIDVVVGRVSSGGIAVWQAKYFTRIGDSQKRAIRESFRRAYTAAEDRGNRLVRWVLCIPINLDVPAQAWWERFADSERSTGVEFGLWDEAEVVRLLMRPQAEDVRRYYFAIPDPGAAESRVVGCPTDTPTEPDVSWHAGDERWIGGCSYVICEPVRERAGADRTLVWREAVAGPLDAAGRVYLRQVRGLRSNVPGLAGARAALREQAWLLRSGGGRTGLPRLVPSFAHAVE